MRDGLRGCAGGADRFAVLDTETTGVYSSDRVIEVAIVTLSLEGEVIDRYDTLVNPRRDVSATHIHGITASMVHDAPTFEDIAGDIAVRLHGACLVAHNVPFDRRMLGNEFGRIGDALVVDRSVDTYVGSGQRLSVACAEHRIDLSGAHRALTDATATAQLFLRLHTECGEGRPVAAPAGLVRSGRVRRRDDLAAVRLPDTPLIAYLAALLPFDGLAVASRQYLDVVGRSVADLHLDRAERFELAAIAADYGMSRPQVIQAHRRFVNELIDAACYDNVVTDNEYEALIRVAAALDIDQATVEGRVTEFRSAPGATTLSTGMQVVFTGEHHRYTRDELEAMARGRGLVSRSVVSKSTDLVIAADDRSLSAKAEKARRYGIPLMTIESFVEAEIGDRVEVSTSSLGLKVVMCPDCHVTWTVPATSATPARRRCAECVILNREPGLRSARSIQTQTSATAWAPPVVEWLTCRGCATVWSRQTAKGRKPHYCPSCSGATILPAPQGIAAPRL